MSRYIFTRSGAPSTPAVDKSAVYVDVADRRVKQLDDNGVISILNNDGLQDRNNLINGGFAIQQRVALASTVIPGITTTTRGGQVADRWAVTTSVASNLNWAQIDSSATPETGLNSRYYGSIIASSAGKKVMLSQWVINADMCHLRGSKVRVSVKTNQKVGSAQTYKLGLLQLTAAGTVDTSPAFLSGAWSTSGGTDPAWGTNLSPITPDASPVGEGGTITGSFLNITSTVGSWLRSSCVFTVPTTAKNLVVVLFSDATGGTTDNLSVAEFQLTQGTEIVEWVTVPYVEELLKCQRFFCKTFAPGTVPAQSAGVVGGLRGLVAIAGAVTTSSCIRWQFPVQMWKSPVTVTFYNPSAANAFMRNIPATTDATATASANPSADGTDVNATGLAGWTVGQELKVHATADAEIVA
jgi:hypothetical protein